MSWLKKRAKPRPDGGTRLSHRDQKAITRVKILLAGRGKRSSWPLSHRERRLLRRRPLLVVRIARALFEDRLRRDVATGRSPT